jgi:phosphomannomutase/phosphoglucomutase
MKLSPFLFRSYDIRGRAFEDLPIEGCRMIGQGFGSELRERYRIDHPRVVVGCDARTHSLAFERAVIEGLTTAGCHVLSIGETPSPVNYFTICKEKLDGGVQVTASHNPPEDNGLKLQIRDAIAFAGEDLQNLRCRIEEEDFLEGKGTLEQYDGTKSYQDFMKTFPSRIPTRTRPLSGLAIVLDGGNGVAGPLYAEILRAQGVEVIEMYIEPDGTFPNHPADPCVWENLRDLRKRVIKERADLGIALDGDGDRAGFIDKEGRIRSSDEILLCLAEDHLSRHPGAPVVFTVSNSSVLPEQVRKWGGRSVMCPVGHSHVEHTMMKEGSLLGGEQSGHFFVAEGYFLFDDAMAAILRILSIFVTHRSRTPTRTRAPFSSLFTRYPKTYQMPEWRPSCPDDRKTNVIRKVTAHFQKTHPCITMDGVRIDFGSGAWAGIRQSNTSPKISVCLEARSAKKLKEVEKIVLSHVKSYPEVGEGPRNTK